MGIGSIDSNKLFDMKCRIHFKRDDRTSYKHFYIIKFVQLIYLYQCSNQLFHFKHALAEVFVIKSSEIGVIDKQYSTLSHLGYILHPGDTVMGYEREHSNEKLSNLILNMN